MVVVALFVSDDAKIPLGDDFFKIWENPHVVVVSSDLLLHFVIVLIDNDEVDDDGIK